MVRQDWSDDDLAQRLHQRDPEALETLISRYSREIFYFIRVVLDGVGVAQDAEECVNDLFVAVWQEIDSFDPVRGTLRTWLTMRAKVYCTGSAASDVPPPGTQYMQSADENRQWTSSDSGRGRKVFGWGGYDSDNRVALPPHPRVQYGKSTGTNREARRTAPRLGDVA